ncbi:hypothetical protein BB934_28905 (plasmid) [Microvirga ossetica]|uniref:Response regulatory domain-containing protein n=1 Tax=Microvirga ossetica TaxID=1882682 RepID=A0A1B2EQT5_9HYPH|nr:hypothetical protein BB934_28905 [Microvirga ossetica]
MVLLTGHMEPAAIVPAFQAGLDGLCSTAMDSEPLIKALELVMLGESFIPAAAGIALFQQRQARLQAHAGGPIAPVSAHDFLLCAIFRAERLRSYTASPKERQTS